MKQNQNVRGKNRARSNGRGKAIKSKNHNGGNRRDMKVKGNPKQLMEKYVTQARDAAQSGDRVMEEYYYQFADHYQRVINELYPNQRQRSSDDGDDRDDEAEDQASDAPAVDTDDQSKSDDASSGQRGSGQRGRGRGRHNNRDQNRDQNRDGNKGRRQNQKAEAEQAVDPADQAQPRMEYPEEMLKEIPVAVKKAEQEDQSAAKGEDAAIVADSQPAEETPKPKRRGRPRKTEAEKKAAAEQKAAEKISAEAEGKDTAEDATLSLPLGDKGDGAAA